MKKTFVLSLIDEAARDDVLSIGVVSGDSVTISDDDYRAIVDKYSGTAHEPSGGSAPAEGPGTELKALLAGWPFRITATKGCSCAAMATRMNLKGCEWCESADGMAEILEAMRSNAEKRGLPYLDAAARLLVKRAIANARRKAAADAQRPPHHDRGEEVAPPVHDAPG